MAMISIVGNRAMEVFGAIGGTIEPGSLHNAGEFLGLPLLAVGIEASRWQGVHLLGSRSAVLEARLELTERRERRGLAAAGSRACEWYRVASGMPALGKELSESFNPYDTGLMEFVNFKKGCYIGQEVIARLDTYQKATRSLSGLVFGQSPEEVATGAPIMREGKEIGLVTSVAPGAIGGVHLGLGVVRTEEIQQGSILQVAGVAATLRSLPMFPPYL
jgi:folate-binding protein YgfZ